MSPDSRQQPKQESLFLSAATAAKNNSTRQIQLTRTERVGPAHRTQHTLQTDPCGAGGTWHLQEVRLLLNLILPFLTSTEILSVVVPHTHTHSGSLSIPAAPAGLCTSEESHLQLFDSRDLHVGRAVVVRTS